MRKLTQSRFRASCFDLIATFRFLLDLHKVMNVMVSYLGLAILHQSFLGFLGSYGEFSENNSIVSCTNLDNRG